MADEYDLLMTRLRTIAGEVDSPPELLDVAARVALSTRRLDGDLAELLMDSALGAPELVRDESNSIRLLSLETATVSVELQLEEAAGRLTLRGLVSGASGEVIVETTTGQYRTEIDAQGWFTVIGLQPGAVRVRLEADDGTPVTTSWVSV